MRGGIHRASIVRPSVGADLSDDEGRALRDDPEPVVFEGVRINALSADVALLAAQSGEEATAALHVPHDTVERLEFLPKAEDEVTISDAGPSLDGGWKVTSAKPTRSYLRVLLRRVTV